MSTLVRRIPRRGWLGLVAVLIGLVGVAAIAAAQGLGPAILVDDSAQAAMEPPRFVEEALAAGIEQTYDGEFRHFVGGGVAAFDCDDDGLTDLYFAGGTRPAGLFRNKSELGGALRFEQLSDSATDLVSVTGAYPLDVDGDGMVDLAVLRFGENVLLRGLGGCRFEQANETLGIDGGDGWTVGFSATWETPRAALPTLAFGDYLVMGADDEWTGDCADGRLVRPAPTGARYADPIVLTPSWCTLSMLFSDWDRSGRRDLRVSNDRHYHHDHGEEQLWRIEPGRPPRLYGRDDGWQLVRIWGMGIASHDLTGDRYPEVYLTSQGDNKLQTLAAGPAVPDYMDVALRRGATAHRPYVGGDPLASTAWHPAFEDVNNDSYTDLYVSKGNVEAQSEYAMKDPSNLLIGQGDGTFVEGAPAAGIVRYDRARGAAVVDLNLDGMPDLVQVLRRTNVAVWRNVGSGTAGDPQEMGHWIGVDLEQDMPNHDAIGAWISVKAAGREVERELTVGGGHASGQLVPLQFGLGATDRAEVRVTWPDGEIGPWLPVDADRVVRVRRGATAVEPIGRE